MTPKECERIYNEAYRAVYWTAIALLKNEADAEDVVQDTFVTLLESYDTLQDKTKVVPWLKNLRPEMSESSLEDEDRGCGAGIFRRYRVRAGGFSAGVCCVV